MKEDFFKRSEEYIKREERINKFFVKYGTLPVEHMTSLLDDLQGFAEQVPTCERPSTLDELLLCELRRRIVAQAFSLEMQITSKKYDYDNVVALYSIPKHDIEGLLPWLQTNRKDALESIDRIFRSDDIEDLELAPSLDIPATKRQAEELAAVNIRLYHKSIGHLLQELTKVGSYLRDINAVPTTEARSYFNSRTNDLAIGITPICYMTEDGILHTKERELIRLYGHEGMGHALNTVLTNNSDLPFFLKWISDVNIATFESVAQFYDKVVFDALKNSPETQRKLNIKHKFDQLYQESLDIAQIGKYKMKVFQYSITVLADKSLGEPKDQDTIKKKIDLIHRVSTNPRYASKIVEGHKDSYDSENNLDPYVISELRYCAKPVQVVLDEFASKGLTYEQNRSAMDEILLTGLWTPQGFVENSRLKAQDLNKEKA